MSGRQHLTTKQLNNKICLEDNTERSESNPGRSLGMYDAGRNGCLEDSTKTNNTTMQQRNVLIASRDAHIVKNTTTQKFLRKENGNLLLPIIFYLLSITYYLTKVITYIYCYTSTSYLPFSKHKKTNIPKRMDRPKSHYHHSH